MNIASIILARGGSKGIPNKNLILVENKPLIEWTIEKSINSKYITNTFVSSDSYDILSFSEKIGAIPIKRPDELSLDDSSSEDSLIHAINTINNLDIVIFLQPTSPLREQKDIDDSIDMFIKNDYDSLFSASKLEDYCIWENIDGKLKSINYDYKNRGFRQIRNIQYLENGSIYIFKPDVLLTEKNRLGGKIGIYLMDYWKSYEIDKIEDVEICEYYLKKIIKNERLS